MILKQAFRLTILFFLLVITPQVNAGTEVLPVQEVVLDAIIHFLSANGGDIAIPAGIYTLTAAEGALRLVSTEGGQTFLLQALTAAHKEKVSEPVARSISLNADEHFLALMLPNGHSLEAVGSYSGVRLRGDWQAYLRVARDRLEEATIPKKIPILEMEPDCINRSPKQVHSRVRQCPKTKGSKKIGPCPLWNPPKSDRCAAMTGRGLPIHFELFGQSDCRTNTKKRKNTVTMIVIHNGDHAWGNARTWMCRKASSHYTINRNGKVYQHVGEERVAWHAGRVNRMSIGIELQIRRGYGSSCNSLRGKKLKQIARKNGVRPKDIIKELCAPTPAQYESLRALIADIKSRHPIATDGIVGHCEVVKSGGHGDPRAFDWRQIGLSNELKQNFVETHNTACNWYGLN